MSKKNRWSMLVVSLIWYRVYLGLCQRTNSKRTLLCNIKSDKRITVQQIQVGSKSMFSKRLFLLCQQPPVLFKAIYRPFVNIFLKQPSLSKHFSIPRKMKFIPVSREKCSRCRDDNVSCEFAEQPVTNLETCTQFHKHGGRFSKYH